MATPQAEGEEAPQTGDLKRKLVRGGIVVGILVAVAVRIIALVPGLSGVRSAISRVRRQGGWLPQS
jgi:hypothetical protein